MDEVFCLDAVVFEAVLQFSRSLARAPILQADCTLKVLSLLVETQEPSPSPACVGIWAHGPKSRLRLVTTKVPVAKPVTIILRAGSVRVKWVCGRATVDGEVRLQRESGSFRVPRTQHAWPKWVKFDHVQI